MTTVTATDAKLKVRLDLSGQTAELKALEEALSRVKKGLAEESGRAKEKSRDEEKTAGEANRQASSGGIRFNPLNPLDTALSAIGAIPGFGNTIEKTLRVGMDIAENGLPLAEGFAKAILKSQGKNGGYAEEFLRGVLKGMEELTSQVAELRAKNDAIAPAFEAVKKIAMAQILAGGIPGTQEIADFGETMFKIIFARSSLDRKVRRLSLEAVGDAGEKLFEGLFR